MAAATTMYGLASCLRQLCFGSARRRSRRPHRKAAGSIMQTLQLSERLSLSHTHTPLLRSHWCRAHIHTHARHQLELRRGGMGEISLEVVEDDEMADDDDDSLPLMLLLFFPFSPLCLFNYFLFFFPRCLPSSSSSPPTKLLRPNFEKWLRLTNSKSTCCFRLTNTIGRTLLWHSW